MRTFRGRPSAIGHARAQHLASLFGRELRVARMAAGLTQADVARLAGVKQRQVSRVELGALSPSLDVRCRMAAACGHELGWRLYPVATIRLRDSGQLAIAQVILQAAHRNWRPRLEVPVSPGDRRAADLVLSSPMETLHIEIERALVDLQAQLRAAQLKRQALAEQTDRPVRLVLAVPDTRTTRARLGPFAELIARTLPARSPTAWRALRSGAPLAADGILFVRGRRG